MQERKRYRLDSYKFINANKILCLMHLRVFPDTQFINETIGTRFTLYIVERSTFSRVVEENSQMKHDSIISGP